MLAQVRRFHLFYRLNAVLDANPSISEYARDYYPAVSYFSIKRRVTGWVGSFGWLSLDGHPSSYSLGLIWLNFCD